MKGFIDFQLLAKLKPQDFIIKNTFRPFMKNLLLLFTFFSTSVSVFGQTYNQTSGDICQAYVSREHTYTGAPEATEAATLSVSWRYCGPWSGNNNGNIDLSILVNGNWVTIVNNYYDYDHGCQWVVDDFTISAATITAARNTAPVGEITIRGQIQDVCSPGVGCNSGSDPCYDATLSYSNVPSANFTSGPAVVCLGDVVTFTDASSGSDLTYDWDFGVDASPATATGIGPHDVTYSMSGTKSVSLDVENLSGVYNTSQSIEVHEQPAISTSSDADICTGDAILIEAFGTGTITWDNGLGTGSSFTVSPTSTTGYAVTITDGNECSNSSSITVTVNDLPAVDAGGDETICSGEAIQLSGFGGGIFEWSNGLGSTSDPEVSPTTETTYTLTVTDGNFCENQDQVTISVNGLPAVDAGDDQEICPGGTANLSALGGDTYNWDNSLGAGQSHIVSPLQSTVYIVTGTDQNQCENTDEVQVTVNQLPIVTASGTATICEGASTFLTAGGANSYSWDNNTGTDAQVSVSPINTTIYTVTGIDANACENTAQVAVIVNETPDVVASADVTICDGQSTTISASGAVSYLWDNGAGNLNFAEVSPTLTETFTVIGTDANNCQGADDVIVIVNSVPTVVASGSTIICAGDMATLIATGADSYLWDNGAGPGQIVEVSPISTTDFMVTGTTNGCDGTDQATVTVNGMPEPAIAQTGTELSTGAYLTYQWYLDGSIINGATEQTYMPLVNGNYTVVVSDVNGCVGNSDQFSILTVAINELSGGDIICYPNPVSDVVYIETLGVDKIKTVKVISILGEVVLETTISGTKGSLDFSSFSSATYLIEIETRDEVRNFRVVKK
jgi:hypothetical protein